MFKKVLSTAVVVASLTTFSYVSADAYPEIDCASDAIFAANACNQCFDGGKKAKGDSIIQLSDEWKNETQYDQALYTQINKPENAVRMVSLNGATWGKDQIADNFWTYTSQLQGLGINSDLEAYVLKAGNSVKRIESTSGSGFFVEENPAAAGTNIGLLVYNMSLVSILDENYRLSDPISHNECVLFKSAGVEAKPADPTPKPTPVPPTGPEHYFLLLLLAMFIAFGVLRFKRVQ